ncbi:MAG: ADP-ribosylglycohydrolase family protein [Polyangiaceae bacterium]|nr:ADP-ribosylglycohydrolase family protein [Polyangiaceae bacterium]
MGSLSRSGNSSGLPPVRSSMRFDPSRVGNTGHVVDAIPLALVISARYGSSVEAAVQAAVDLGGDTDTVAALAAQVVGAGGAVVSIDLVRQLPAAVVETIDAFARLV